MRREIYFYRGYTIFRMLDGWMYGESDHNIYKTIRDVKNAIRKHIDGTQECEPTIIGVAEYLSTGEWVLKEI